MLELTEYQRERLELIEHKLKFVTDKPLVACIEGPGKVRSAGIYMDELVALAGEGSPLFLPMVKKCMTLLWSKTPIF
ncbi:hypothetical protein [Mucilaginibacter sp. HD30]